MGSMKRRAVGIAAAGESVRVSRIDPDRLVVVADRTVKIALGAVRIAAAGEGVRVLRIEPNRLVDIGKRAIEIAQRLLRRAAVLI